MSDDDLILAELLCARLVHDLSGPVGAVANGVELLGEEETPADLAGEAIGLLAGSAAAAVARLRFLRQALGTQGATPPPAELRRLAVDYFTKGAQGGDAVALEWPATLDPTHSGMAARLVLNLLMVARDCLPRGGTVRLSAGGNGGLACIAQGPQAAFADAAKALAAAGAAGLSPRGAQGFLAARLARQAGMKIAATAQAGRVTLTLDKT